MRIGLEQATGSRERIDLLLDAAARHQASADVWLSRLPIRPEEGGSQKSETAGTGVRRWLSELSRIATTVITVRERMAALVDENLRLRAQVERLSEIVAHQAGQFGQLDKRIEDLVELHVLKRLDAQKSRSKES